MCGIVGMYDFTGEGVDADTLKASTRLIKHRGPDDEGFYIDNSIGLGFRRLSIIDLDTGEQPIHNENESIWIVFNGEIYNHLELKDDLKGKGHKYYTKTDTETIVHAWEEYGTKCVEKLNGMFAFAIWDSNKKTVFLARDRLGIKPLYYLLDDGRLIFASELKSIIEFEDVERKLDVQALSYYLTYNYIPAPHTIFSGIKKLAPGHTLTVSKDENQLLRFWNLNVPSRPYVNLEYFKAQTIKLLKQSVHARLMSDVPLGAFLSGGIDSSAIVALMSEVSREPVKTFSIGFEEHSFNELEYAKIVSDLFGTEHHEFVVKTDALSILPKLVYHFDEPFADSSAIPTYLVSEMAAKHVTVCLSGDGGDEQFGGYDRYAATKFASYYEKVPRWVRHPVKAFVNVLPVSMADKSFVKMSKRFVNAVDMNEQERYADWVTIMNRQQRDDILTEDVRGRLKSDPLDILYNYYNSCPSDDFLTKTMYVDIHTYLVDDILVKVDRMSMANSLEVRVPFLDHNVVEFTSTIPSYYKIRGRTLKYILKESLKGRIPKTIINRKKHGFGVPLGRWFKDELRGLTDSVLIERNPRCHKYVKKQGIEKLLAQHRGNVRDHSHKIWALLMFELWHRHYIDGEDIQNII